MTTILDNIKKGITVIAISVTAFSLFSRCSDILDTDPLGKLNESVFTTKNSVDKLLIACYSPLNGYINGVWGISSGPDNCFFGDMGSGNIHKGSTLGDLGDFLNMERFKTTSENDRIRDKWILVYGAIERCNDVLRTLRDKEISDMKEDEKTQVIAEVRFLRAYYHFEAKKIWNMVPYIDETVEDPQRRVPNDRDIWPDIEADFSFAAAELPEEQEEPGRPTKSAAKAFLAKAYLFQQKFTEAKPLLDGIITSQKYELLPNFYDNFNAELNNSIEAIWQNQVAVNVAGAGYDRSQRGGDLSFPNAPDQPNLSGAGFNQPTFDLVNAYQTDANGLPMIDSYFNHEFKNDMGVGSKEAFTPDNTTPVDPRLDWTVGRRGVPYHDWAIHPGNDWIREQVSGGPYNQKKYTIQKSQLGKYAHDETAKFNAINFNIIRYAQILLWAAECEIENGSPEKAREYVNMIRARARDGIYVKLGENAPFGNGADAANYKIGEYQESWTGKSKEDLYKMVRFEHRLEFALEGHYFFDLVRWNIAEREINAYIAREKDRIEYLEGVTFTKKDRYFPIPLTEIDRSYKDGKPTLTQNPEY